MQHRCGFALNRDGHDAIRSLVVEDSPIDAFLSSFDASNTKRRGTPNAPAIFDAAIASTSRFPFTTREIMETLIPVISVNHWISRP